MRKLIPLHAGPGFSEAELHKVIYHPLTGLCIVGSSFFGPLRLGSCDESIPWTYPTQKTLTIQGTFLSLRAEGLGKPAKLVSKWGSKWETISDSKLHFSTRTKNGVALCLDIDSTNKIVTNRCKCLSGDSSCDPSSQWFKLVDSTRRSRMNSIRMARPILDAISDFFTKSFWWKLYNFV